MVGLQNKYMTPKLLNIFACKRKSEVFERASEIKRVIRVYKNAFRCYFYERREERKRNERKIKRK